MGLKLPRMTIVYGCISSGKTWVCNHKAIKHIVDNYEGKGLIFFIGRTLKTLERNVLEPLALQYKGDFDYSLNQKKATIAGIKIELEGCNDEMAETKIRGSTAEFIYGDELTLWNRAFLVRCMGSLRTSNAVFLGTTNPDGPMNFVKTDYIDRGEELGLLNLKFTMSDNPSLTKEYIDQVSKEYTGVFHDRFIKGLWVAAEGLVYPGFDEDKHVVMDYNMPESYEKYWAGVDYGMVNPMAMGLWGLKDGIYYCIREYYHSGKDGALTDEDYYNALEVLVGKMPISSVVVDPSAKSFINLIRKKGRFIVKGAKNDVLPGISECGMALNQGIIKINESCVNFIKEFGMYAWDMNSALDKPIKEADHMMDQFRYVVYTLGWVRGKSRLIGM